jgi:amino acid adenylation domain-containing protein
MKRVDKKNIEDILALTPMQEGMLFHYVKDPGNSRYFEQLSLDISGEINRNYFEQAWNFVIRANEMLRTVFRWEKIEKPVQVILNHHPFKPKYYDFPGIEKKSGRRENENENETKKWIEEIKTKEWNESFDLSDVPFRVTLCKMEEKKYEMIISNHHILYDGWSNGTILKEFFDVYDQLEKKKTLPTPPVKTKFKEFVERVKNQDRKKQETFWRTYLEDFETPTELPVKNVNFYVNANEKPGARIKTIGCYKIKISKEVNDSIRDFVKKHKVTLASLVYSAWGILLQKYTNTRDVVFGTTVSGRTASLKGIEDMVGLFINTLPLRIRTYAGETVVDLVIRTNDTLRVRDGYEGTSLVKIKEYSAVSQKQALFDSIVVVENYPLDFDSRFPLRKGGLTVHLDAVVEMTHYEVSVVVSLLFDHIDVRFIYNSDLFEEAAVEKMANRFMCMIPGIIERPETKVSTIEIISGEEKNRILYEFNDTKTEYPGDRTIHELFEEQVDRTPDRIAVIGKGHGTGRSAVTYRQLNQKSNRLAHLIRKKGVQPGTDTVVALMVERSIEMIEGILGILKAGGAYLPIDPGYPGERKKYMLKDTCSRVLLTQGKGNNIAGTGDENGIEIIDLENETNYMETAVGGTGNKRGVHQPGNLAYIIYTSGTTGKPRGTLTTHFNVIRVLKNTCYIELKVHDRLLQLSNVAFDGSVFDIYGALLNGAALVLIERETVLTVDLLAEIIKKEEITVFFVTTALFNALVDLEIECLKNIRKILFGGERVSVEHSQKALEYLGKDRMIHVYGPTETTVYATYYFIDQINPGETMGTIPIGKPISNTTIYILDKDLKPVPIGTNGEIYIGGHGNARGYLNHPELTADSFDRDFQDDRDDRDEKEKKKGIDKNTLTSLPLYPSTPLYRTGDLARWLPDGNILFLGRIDSQVKIRGFRVELGEIEYHLLRFGSIDEAVVTARENKKGDRYLCAYMVSGVEPSVSELRHYLSDQLPDYMVPSYFIKLEKMPLTPNGKVDHNALPMPEIKTTEPYTAPRNKVEERLAEVWSSVLGIEKESIGIDSNFFELGGHSLKATILTSRIYKEFNVRLPLTRLFKTPVIRGLAGYIKKAAGDTFISIRPVEKKEYHALSSAQKRLYVLQQMEKACTGYNMTAAMVLEGDLEKDKLENTFSQVIKRHENLRTSFEVIDEEPVQRIHENVEFGMDTFDLIKHFVRPFDLSRAPLLRIGLKKTSKTEHILVVDMHHIIADGTSIGIFINDFTALYKGEGLPGIRIQYKDFSQWQHNEMGKKTMKRQETYWLKEYKDGIPVLNLPTDFERPGIQGFEGEVLNFNLGNRETPGLKKLAEEEDVTLFMLLFSLFNILLFKICGQEKIIVGTAAAGRRHADLEQVMGMFVNTLAIKTDPGGDQSFHSFLARVKKKTLEAFENQDFQFEELVEKVMAKRKRDRRINPLFDVIFVLQNIDTVKIEIPGLKLKSYDDRAGVSPFDLYFTVEERGDNLSFNVGYSIKLFKITTIQRFIDYYEEIIVNVLGNRDIKLKDIEISHHLLEPKAKEKTIRDALGDFGF